MRDFTIRRASAVRTSCTCCTTPISRKSTPAWPRTRASVRSWSSGRARRNMWVLRPWGCLPPSAFSTISSKAPIRSPPRTKKTPSDWRGVVRDDGLRRREWRSGAPGRPGQGRPLYRRGAHQPLDHGDLAGTARTLRACAVPSGPVLPHRLVRRWRKHTDDPSLDRSVVVLQLLRPIYPLLAGESVEGRGRHLARTSQGRADQARRAAAGSWQIQCRPEGGVLADVDPDHRADLQRSGDLGQVFLDLFERRHKAHRRADPLDGGGDHYLRLDRPRLCRDLGA